MLQNPCKSAKFNYDTCDRILNRSCLLAKGWQAKRKGCKVSMAGLFQHICPLQMKIFLQLIGLAVIQKTIFFEKYSMWLGI